MAEPDNIVLVYLRRIDEKVDALSLDIRELKERMTAVEIGQAALRRDIAQLAETDARLQAGVDRLREDVGRIRRRLDIAETPTA